MFGYYDIPLRIVQGDISLSVEKKGEVLTYMRECLGEKVTKTLLTSGGKMVINPVEPLNKPKGITPYLLTEFRRTLVVEPKSVKKIYLTFPIEMGVYIAIDKEIQVIDIFTLAKQKLTLYGDPRNGVICKYWKSEVYDTVPSIDHTYEGILEFTLSNTTPEWVEVKKAVLSAYGMKIWYSDYLVTMKASMKLKTGGLGETDFEEAPLENGMKNALEIYTTRKISVTSTKFVMEFGL